MAIIPRKPESTKAATIEDIIGQQEKIRDESTSVQPQPKKAVKPKISKPKTSKPAKALSAVVETTLVPVVQQTGRPAAGVAPGDRLKPTQYSLPYSLTERVAKIAGDMYAGNRSYLVRMLLEKGLDELESKNKKTR